MDKNLSERIKKWNQRYLSGNNTIPEPALVLKNNSHLLPSEGCALDLACGLGGNALYMARAGLNVHAWDFSTVAIDKLRQLASNEKLTIQARVTDVSQELIPPNSFDVIVVSYYLDRSITEFLINALKPNGMLFYQTYTLNKISDIGPANPDFLLKDNELLELFKELQVRVYREEMFSGDTNKGLRNEALFIGEKLDR